MIKFFKKILIVITIITANHALALNSSSYLITNTAVNLYDFEKAYSYFDDSNAELSESDLENKLLTTVNLNLLKEAYDIAKNILEVNQFNQLAWMAFLTFEIRNNQISDFKKYQKKFQDLDMNFIEYVFFDNDGLIKEEKLIAQSIFELVQSSLSNKDNQPNYKFILFYLSIVNILDKNFDQAYFYSARIYEVLENFNKANFFYEKIKIDNNLYIESQKNIAINKSRMGSFDEAEKKLFKLKENYKDHSELLLALAEFYRFEKKYAKAIKYYTDIILKNDFYSNESWRLYYLRAISFERSNQWEQAEKDLLDSLKINPNSPDVLNYLAYGWLERDIKIDSALEMLKKAYDSNPDSYYILDSLAWAYYKKNELDKAAELMEKVINMVPGEVISLDHLADIYFAMKRKREARFLWKQALDLAEPEDVIFDSLKKKLELDYAG